MIPARGAATPVEYLDLADLLRLAERANLGPVRDLGLLDSAAYRPQSGFGGEDVYPTLSGKAAALLHSLVSNHALVDGNKRLAFLATVVFLRINGYDLAMSDADAFTLMAEVASGKVDVDDIALRLRLSPTA